MKDKTFDATHAPPLGPPLGLSESCTIVLYPVPKEPREALNNRRLYH